MLPLAFTSSLLLLLSAPASSATENAPDNHFELMRDFQPEDFELARTFDGFNSTALLTGLAVGAVLILLLGVGLYLYDYYATGTSRTEPLPDQQEYYAYSQYQNAEQAYPAVAAQAAAYRFVNE